MKLDFNITLDTSEGTVKDNIETNTMIEGLKTTSNTFTNLDLPNICTNFMPKVISILKVLGCYKNIYWLQQVKYKDSTEKVYVLNVINNVQTAAIFDVFKKLGINLASLRIGYSENLNKIYLTNKLLKDLNKFGGMALTQVCMFLISVVKLFDGLTTHPLNISYEPGIDTAIVNDEFLGTMEYYLYNFNQPNNVTFTEILLEDIERIYFYKTAYTSIPNNCELQIGTFTLIKAIKNTGEENINILYNYGAKAMNPNFIRIADKTMYRTVLVNEYLNGMDLDTDTVFSLIASTSSTGTIVIYTKDIMPNTSKYTALGYDEDILSDPLKKLTSKFLEIGITDSFNIIEASKLLGITFKTEGIVDASTLKAEYETDAYAQELYKQYQDYYDSFDLKDLASIVKSFAIGTTYSMLLYGPSGCGKSTAARVVPYKCGLPYISVNFSTNIEESDLIGTMIPNEKKKTADDPEFVWQDGILTNAIRKGYTFVAEEINFARPGILSKLNSLLDEFRQIDLPTGEIVKAHKNFRIIATCNIAYEGTNRFNKALINRFELIYEFKELPREELINIIISRTGYPDRGKIEKILNVYDAIKKYSKEQNLDLVISLRQLLNLFKQGKYFKNAQLAVEVMLINSAFVEDSDYKENFTDTVLRAFDLKFKI